jgi:hypothetical protein
MTQSPIKFGIMLQGAGGHMNSWKHPKRRNPGVAATLWTRLAERFLT